MQHTRVFVFGNPDLPIDSLPLQLIPVLKESFPDISFETLDPNEEWDVPKHMLIIDTVVNLKQMCVFTDLKVFMAAPRMTCHDFDAYANIMLMKKIGKIADVTILGIPPGPLASTNVDELVSLLWKELEKEG